MVWGVSPELPGTGLGALAHAMRHVARVGRPVGGSGAMPEAVLAAYLAAGGKLLTGRHGDADPTARATPCAASRSTTAPSSTRRWSCRPATRIARSSNGSSIRRRAAQSTIERWRQIDVEAGYESKVDAVLSAPPVMKAIGAPTGTTITVAPSLAEIDRGYHEMLAGRVLDRPALLRQRADRDRPDDGARRSPRSSRAQPGGALHAVPPAGRLAGLVRAAAAGSSCSPRCASRACSTAWSTMRAMTPDVYEREFHLPAGHATSFAGGPLAVFRSKDPELTRYETAVDRAVPHRRGDVSRRRRVGRQRTQLRRRRARPPTSLTRPNRLTRLECGRMGNGCTGKLPDSLDGRTTPSTVRYLSVDSPESRSAPTGAQA